jgi:uncharacterized protein YodC (DUF2158 family)
MANLKPGDVVRLKSGGPRMTIRDAADSGLWLCDWFEGGKHEQDVFTEAQLKLVESAEKDKA